MRDPLGWVPVKYKLPLTFVSLCLVAFGVGGVVVTSTAREALEREIRQRLDGVAETVSLVLDRHLELVARRITACVFFTHVSEESRDEVGDLARGFNLMARTVKELTRELAEAAESLQRCEREARAGHDRVATVLRAMEDGVFLLDPEGKVTL